MGLDLWGQYGLAGLVAGATLALVWKVVDRGWTALERRVGTEDTTSAAASLRNLDGLNPLQCQVDPLHFQHVREAHEILERMDQGWSSGAFSCAFKDRDEVRDVLELHRATLEAQNRTTEAVGRLTEELGHLTREIRHGNGRSAGG